MSTINTSNEFIALFNRANIILSASVLRAEYLRNQADKIKHSTNVNTWIKNSTKKDQLKMIADRTEARGRKVWDSICSFQGKYINWRHLTSDGSQIFDIIMSTNDRYDSNLPASKKLAGI